MNCDVKSASTVLIVDDFQLMCVLIKDTLLRLPSLSCVVKNELTAATQFLLQHPIDMAIIDLNLNDRSGFDLIYHIRCGNFACPNNIPIFVISGNTFKSRVSDCIDFKVQEILAKPLQPITLQERALKYLKTNLELESPQYFEQLKKDIPPLNSKKLNASILKSQETTRLYVSDIHKQKSEQSLPNYQSVIQWPDATTGHHRLDNRLHRLSYHINMLLHISADKELLKGAPSIINKLNELTDNIIFIANKYSQREPESENWPTLKERMTEFQSIPFADLAGQTVNRNAITSVSKQASAIWRKLTGKPVFKRK